MLTKKKIAQGVVFTLVVGGFFLVARHLHSSANREIASENLHTGSSAQAPDDSCNILRDKFIGKNLEIFGPTFDDHGDFAKKGSLKLFELKLSPMSYAEKRQFLLGNMHVYLLSVADWITEGRSSKLKNKKINKSLVESVLKLEGEKDAEKIKKFKKDIEIELIKAAKKIPALSFDEIMDTLISRMLPLDHQLLVDQVLLNKTVKEIENFDISEDEDFNVWMNLFIENLNSFDVEKVNKISEITKSAIEKLELYQGISKADPRFVPFNVDEDYRHDGIFRLGKVYTFMSKGITIESSSTRSNSSDGISETESTTSTSSVSYSNDFLNGKYSDVDAKSFKHCMLSMVENASNAADFLFPNQNDFWFRRIGQNNHELIFSAVEYASHEDGDEIFKVIIRD